MTTVANKYFDLMQRDVRYYRAAQSILTSFECLHAHNMKANADTYRHLFTGIMLCRDAGASDVAHHRAMAARYFEKDFYALKTYGLPYLSLLDDEKSFVHKAYGDTGWTTYNLCLSAGMDKFSKELWDAVSDSTMLSTEQWTIEL